MKKFLSKSVIIAFGFILTVSHTTFAQNEFITRWNLRDFSGSGDTQISFNVATSGIVNYSWVTEPAGFSGSGTFTGTTALITGLPAGSIIHLSISPTNFQRIIMNNGVDRGRLETVEHWGTTIWTSMQYAFATCNHFYVEAFDAPNLSAVTDMSHMFSSCTILTVEPNSWNTSNVTNMSYLFANSNVVGDVGSWNTSNVTNMSGMFSGIPGFNRDISGWNTGNVTNMSFMFSNGFFNQNIGNWNTSKVTDMSYMFSGSFYFNQNIGAWDVSKVTNMSNMFSYSNSFNQDISGWNTSKVTDMSSMFSGSRAFNKNLDALNISNVTNMSNMFSNILVFNQSLAAWGSKLNPNVNLSGLLNFSSISTANYDATLNGFSTTTVTGRTMDAIGIKYCGGSAARAILVAPVISGGKGWSINDDGPLSPAPTFSFGLTSTICSGAIVPVLPNVSNNSITGIWLPSVVSNTTSGVYTFSTPGCNYGTSYTVTVNKPTTIVTQPVSQTVPNGNVAIFVVSATGTGVLAYSWSNGATTSGINTSVAGAYSVTVTGTCGIAISNVVNLINPNAPVSNYFIGPISTVENCSANKFKVPVYSNTSVPGGIIGYAINLPYDPTLMTPTGVISYGEVLTSTGAPLVSSIFSNTLSGQVVDVINVYANFTFTGAIASGAGKIMEVEFALQPGISPQNITVGGTIYESYVTSSTGTLTITSGLVPVIPNDQQKLKGTLLARGLTTRPITSLGTIQTVVYGASGNTISSTALQTVTGNTFTLSLPATFNGVGIIRDIDNASVVTPVINSADAVLVQKIANNLPPYNTTPATVLQLMAADVNSDGKIGLSDWILIQERVINTITTFPNTPDWKFTESSNVSTFTGQNSNNFPASNSIVSVSPVNNANGCTTLGDRTITGILTGDVDGSWNNATNGATFRKQSEDVVILKFDEAVYKSETEIQVPVYISSEATVNALDIDLGYETSQVDVEATAKVKEEVSMVYNKYQSKRLLVSNVSYSTFDKSKAVMYVTFKGQKQLSTAHINQLTAYVNGVESQSKLESLQAASESPTVTPATGELKIFPNPSEGGLFYLNNLGEGTKTIKVYDLAGSLKGEYSTGSELFYELNLSNLSQGVYLFKLTSDAQTSTHKIVVK